MKSREISNAIAKKIDTIQLGIADGLNMLSQREPNIEDRGYVEPVGLIEKYCNLGAADIIKTVVTISPFGAVKPLEGVEKYKHCFDPILADFVTTIHQNFHREWKILNFEQEIKIGIMGDGSCLPFSNSVATACLTTASREVVARKFNVRAWLQAVRRECVG